MIIQRICFLITWVCLLLGGGLWGVSGGVFITEQLWHGPVVTGPIQLFIDLFLWSFGGLIGLTAAVFGAILPLYFKFPNARRRFAWESTDPPAVFRFYQWYGTQLTAYGAARERGES